MMIVCHTVIDEEHAIGTFGPVENIAEMQERRIPEHSPVLFIFCSGNFIFKIPARQFNKLFI